jgi:Ni/Co efflux regulator RcnB
MLMACTAMMTCLSGTSLMAQAQDTSTKSVQAEHTNERYKIGDTAHDLYKDERVGIKDWQNKGLKAPQKDSQWVLISDKYVLVQMDSGKILDIAPVKTKPLKK